MGLISTISNAANGLGVVHAQIATTSHNIANVNTEGYARQEAVQTESAASPVAGTRCLLGGGVVLQAIYQKRDQYVERQLPRAFANSASSSAESESLEAVTTLNPDAIGGLTSALGNFYSSLRALAQNAGDAGLRQSVVDAARGLSVTFNQTAQGLEAARTGVDGSVEALVLEVNSSAQAIAALNRRISIEVCSGGSPNDLIDQRQRLIDKMANLVGTSAVPDDRGNVSLALPGGTTLVSGPTACALATQTDPANAGHVRVVFTPTDGTPPQVLKTSELGGKVAGQLHARDDVLGKAVSDLDALAFDLAGALNVQHQKGVDLYGQAGAALFVVPATASGASSAIAVSSVILDDPSRLAASATAAGVPGDAANLQSIIDTEQKVLPSGLNAQQAFAKIVSDFGVAIQSAKDRAAFQGSVLKNLKDLREATSGVSIDDEMVGLVRAQHSYSALSKVITTTQSMLDTLMGMIR